MDVLHYTAYRLNLYALPPLLASAATIALALRVWRDKRGALATGPFVLMCFPIAVWMAGIGLLLSSREPSSARLWAKLVHVGVPFIPATIYQFWTALLRTTGTRRRLLAALWALSASFALTALLTDTVVAGLYLYPWGYYGRFGWLAPALAVYMAATFALGLAELWRRRRRREARAAASRVPAFLIAFGILALGAVDLLPAHGVGVYPAGAVFVLGFLWRMALAIRSHGLGDIAPGYAARSVMDTMVEGLFVCDGQGRVRLVNNAATTLLGFTEREVLGRALGDLVGPSGSREGLERALADQGRVEHENVLRSCEGEPVHVSLVVSRLHPQTPGGGTVVLVRDMTDLKQAEQQILFHAYHDGVTGLPNRAMFRAELARALSRAEQHGHALAVLAVSANQFSLVSQSLGRVPADALLAHMAERLRGGLRESDVVGRLGDDEFGVLVCELTDTSPVPTVLHKLMEAVSQPFVLAGLELHATVSIGVAVYPHDAKDADQLIKAADTALHQAREAGRDAYQLFMPEMNRVAAERLAVQNSLHRALERNELVIHYQPIVHVGGGETVAVEALSRWQHPQRGLLYPPEFIAAAEDTNLIVPLGEAVLRAACAQAVEWRRSGQSHLRLSVNVSLKQMRQRRFSALVGHVLEKTGLPADALDIEITESTAAADIELTVRFLASLREMGVGVSIDDFGTGYSSLSYLKRFPVTAIKIDRGFVRDLPASSGDAAVVSAILTLARSLGLEVIAEGVESPVQAEFLRRQGCELMQGFLFGAAAPAEGLRRPAVPGGSTHSAA